MSVRTRTDRTTAATGRPSLLVPGLRAVALAALAAALVHVLFDVAGADFVVEPPGQSSTRVGLLQAMGVAALATAVGVLVTLVAARRTRRPERVALALAVLGLLLFAPNPVLAADSTLTVVALEAMHVAVAAAFLGALLPALRASRTSRSR